MSNVSTRPTHPKHLAASHPTTSPPRHSVTQSHSHSIHPTPSHLSSHHLISTTLPHPTLPYPAPTFSFSEASDALHKDGYTLKGTILFESIRGCNKNEVSKKVLSHCVVCTMRSTSQAHKEHHSPKSLPHSHSYTPLATPIA